MEKVEIKKETMGNWTKMFIYGSWILVSLFYVASIWFMNYGTQHAIYHNPSPGVEYYTFATYKVEDMGFIIFPIFGWLAITFCLIYALEEKLREKISNIMQRIWADKSRSGKTY
jgi:hypothetical protein